MNPKTSPEKPGSSLACLYGAVVLTLLGLIFMTSSHIKSIRDHTAVEVEKNRKDTELLKKAGERGRKAEKLIDALRKLAQTDTTAARILEDFFPASPPPAPDFQIKQEQTGQSQVPSTK